MLRSLLGVAALVAAAGCVHSDATQCGNDIICASERTCAMVGDRALCVLPEQLTVCSGIDDAQACEYSGSIGTCQSSVCLPTVCGDGVISGGEECEASVALSEDADSCNDLEFYDDVPLQCTACVFDRAACREAGASYCGDNVRDFVDGEYCDGALPLTGDSCVTFGYDAGELTCNNALCTPGFAGCLRLRWSVLASGAFARGIWGAGPTDIYAVGANGLLAHSDGSSWTQVMPAPTTENLEGIYGTSATDIYVVGGDSNRNGLVLHFDGTSWTPMTLPAGTKALKAVWVGGGTGVAVGDEGTVIKLAGGAWTTVTAPTAGGLYEVWGVSATEIYVGGQYTGAQSGLYKYDGASWTPQTLPEVSTIYAITSVPTGEVYVGGHSQSGPGIAAKLVGSSWSEVAMPACTGTILDLWGTSSSDVYAAAIGGAEPYWRTMFHYSGTSFTPIESPTSLSVRSIWGTGPDNIYIGSGIGIAQGDGRFRTLPPLFDTSGGSCQQFGRYCSDDPQSAIAGRADNDVYVFGTTNCHYDGQNWAVRNFVSPPGIFRYSKAWVSPNGVAFVVGDGRDIGDACAAGRTKTSAMVGWGTTVLQSSALEPTPSRDTELRDVWGTADNNVFAIGSQSANACGQKSSLFLRYNGASWTEITGPTNISSPLRLAGVSGTEIYAMGLGGLFARFNGSSWTALASFPQTCPAAMDLAVAAGQVYGTCLNDRHIYRYAAASDTWELAGQPSFATSGLETTLLALGPDDFFVFGGNADGTGTITSYKAGVASPVRGEGQPIVDAWGTPERLFWIDAEGVHSLVRAVPW